MSQTQEEDAGFLRINKLEVNELDRIKLGFLKKY